MDKTLERILFRLEPACKEKVDAIRFEIHRSIKGELRLHLFINQGTAEQYHRIRPLPIDEKDFETLRKLVSQMSKRKKAIDNRKQRLARIYNCESDLQGQI